MEISFTDLGLRGKILELLNEKEFEQPTAIQKRVIPAALTQKDVIGISRTGTGKTLAFLLPILEMWMDLPNKSDEPLSTILIAPSKELAHQLAEEVRFWGQNLGIECGMIYGGMKKRPLEKVLGKRPHVLVATPGKLRETIDQGIVKGSTVKYLVLDEADQMLESGLWKDVEVILHQLPAKRQNFFFSATIPNKLKETINAICTNPEWIEVQKHSSNKLDIDEKVYYVGEKDKTELLMNLMYDHLQEKSLVFFNDRFLAKEVYNKLKKADFSVELVHGKKSQATRIKAISDIQKGDTKILLATDVIGRGLDISDVKVVVNFEMPDNKENYEHRIGRTGRQGKSGIAITFCDVPDLKKFRTIQKLHKETITEVFGHSFNKEMPSNVEKTKLRNKGMDGSNTHRMAWNDLIGKK